MELEIERDMPECEKWNMEPTFRHDTEEETTYEQAEREQKEIEANHKHLWNETHL